MNKRHSISRRVILPILMGREPRRDNMTYLFERMALNKNTSKEVLRKLARHKAEEVRAHVSINKKTPKDVLEKLSYDKSLCVHSYLSTNTKLSKEDFLRVFRKASKDGNIVVLENLATNRKTPLAILVRIAKFYGPEFYSTINVARNSFEKRTDIRWKEYQKRLILKRLTPKRRKYFKELGITEFGKLGRGKGRKNNGF